MVSKFQFSMLFSQAWSNGMTIDNVTSGFRTSEVFPFNPKAILDKLPASDDPNRGGKSGYGDSSGGNPPAQCEAQPEKPEDPLPTPHNPPEDLPKYPGLPLPPSSEPPNFPPDNIELFKRRFENNYNIYTDIQYVMWLQLLTLTVLRVSLMCFLSHHFNQLVRK